MQNIFEIPNIDGITPIESLQRNERWNKERLGKFTGSKFEKLMGCTQSTSKMTWDRPERIIDFGETAKKYIFSRAKERQSGITLIRSIGQNGEYGKNVEPLILEILKEKYPAMEFEDVGFIEFIKGIAGASPDGLVDQALGLEIKAPMFWETVYTRMEIPFDQKHDDFWQIQGEMMSLNVPELMYVVADPPEDIYEPVIKNTNEKIVQSSPIHQQAIKHRCMIGNAAIELYLDGMVFQEAMRVSCTEYEF